mmetsp:Transcript_47043/g.131126  ORF Transcript_47043/g.131126 Transcript_47043/m.131126 type:complete len:455 (-) Transcript_47043:18-1382(-)
MAACYERMDASSIIANAQRRARRAASADASVATIMRQRVVERLPQLPRSAGNSGGSAKTAGEASAVPKIPPAPRALGVSAAFLYTFMSGHRPSPEVPPEGQTTRAAALALKRRMEAAGERGAFANRLHDEMHFVTGGQVIGRASVHVAHAWGSRFEDIVEAVVADANGNYDTYYAFDVLNADLHDTASDPVVAVQQAVGGAAEILLVLDSEARGLSRLWVLFEAMLAMSIGKKLRVRCASQGGFGASEMALEQWEARIDAADWVLAEATRKSDEKRIRGFVGRSWEQNGKGTERMLAQLKLHLRKDIYGQILLGAVMAGDRKAVDAALSKGANPEQQDWMGNTAEELAIYIGREDIKDVLFLKRMGLLANVAPSSLVMPYEHMKAQFDAVPDEFAPFLTESAGEEEDDQETTDGGRRLDSTEGSSSDTERDHGAVEVHGSLGLSTLGLASHVHA